MKRQQTYDEPIAGVNIVPIIDVTLVLLVVLLVLSPIINIPSMKVDLPEAMTKETKDQNLTVSLGADGLMSIDADLRDPRVRLRVVGAEPSCEPEGRERLVTNPP